MTQVSNDRERLRSTFESAAASYQQARPDYPAELYDELIRLAGLRPGDQLLEIGCATGKATAPLARRGFRVTCVELGRELAAQARRQLAGYPGVTIDDGAFETWLAPTGVQYQLVFAATAWHWLDPAVRYQKAWDVLAPGGHLAFWAAEHVFPADGDPIFDELQPVYDEIGSPHPADKPLRPRPGALPDSRAEIEASGLFGDVVTRQFDWAVSYPAEEYIGLLDTFSSHIALAPWQRDRLYSEVRRRLAARPDGRLLRHWGAVLHVARRLGRAAG
jgi:SAM-dependent methyltransferase